MNYLVEEPEFDKTAKDLWDTLLQSYGLYGHMHVHPDPWKFQQWIATLHTKAFALYVGNDHESEGHVATHLNELDSWASLHASKYYEIEWCIL